MNINFSSPINNTGYGIASFNILKELIKNNNVSYFPIGGPGVNTQEDYDIVSKLINNQDDFDVNAPFIKIWHQFDLAQRIGKGKYFAYPFFELDTLNKREKKHLSVPDEIFVSSKWAKQILENNGIESPIHVIPLGVDLSIFNIPKKNKDDKYVFLNIGKWELRKGHDLLPKLLDLAFPNNENVELWILAPEHTNSYSSKEEIDQWKNLYKSDRIKVFTGFNTHQEVAELISKADCGLFPSRAEGWNLELLETIVMDKPAIATNYSAHTEFCNKENCYLIDITETEIAYDGKAFTGQGNWAKIGQAQIDQTIEFMRLVYQNNIRNNPGAADTANLFCWKNSSDKILGCI
jgi:glycosyltransferase involved in cell wall biosynthesis